MVDEQDLSFNSFEQLCINYANEYLQFFFNRIVFREEQEEYSREQIPWQDILFSDNQACIDLISSKPHGILRILDDQSCFPQATDHTFLQKCHYHHGNNQIYLKPKMPLPEFTIKHFAGPVTYQNYDQVGQEVLDLFSHSKNKMVANLFLVHAEVVGQHRGHVRKSSTVTRRHQPPTVSTKFTLSLLELVDKMQRCNSSFIRCIKPNGQKEPGVFETELVSRQLRYSGILETIRIRREGYPVRLVFNVFLFRYKSLVGLKQPPAPDGENCVIMLSKLVPLRPGAYQVGVTKLFLKEDVYQLLESKRERVRQLAALTLQRYTRMFFVRKRYKEFRTKIIRLQAHCRGFLTRKRYLKMKKSLVKFRSLIHMYVNRKRYVKELTKREVVNVTHLVIPAELGYLLQAAAGGRELHSDCLALVQAPHIQEEKQLTLPLDINNFPFSRYVRLYFREPKFGMLTVPLEMTLTRTDDALQQEALELFIMILRFMGDPHLNGAQENLFGNYIIQRGLANQGLRDEILAQLANQTQKHRLKQLLDSITLLPSSLSHTLLSKDTSLCPDTTPGHSGEDLAGDILLHRGVCEAWRGWSILMKEHGQWAELAGHDYVMDLISDLELPSDFPKQKSYFIISAEDPNTVRTNTSLTPQPAYSLPDSEGYSSHVEADGFSDGQTQRGMEQYLDSLFNPVLSDGSTDLDKPASMTGRMKGGGGIGGEEERGQAPASRPYPPGLQPGGQSVCLSAPQFSLSLS
ncbi:hypothetical protein J4Q44_G00387280 [Coregonus suidteri]|uniref:Uncharacterized protein n=1 Tax=Coregonus suidteri TaxID=861788 RepID=A0AAN8QIV2_9TELE